MAGAALTGATALSLHPDHLADLRKSGLADDMVRAAGLHSVRPCDLSRIIGFAPQGVTSALAFPYAGDGGFSRVKVFPSYRDKDGHLVKYLQKKGTGARLYIPPGCEAVLHDASVPLAVTEGEKKALRLTQEGTLSLGIGGLWNWFAQGEPIPDLDKVTWRGRPVTVYPDSDVWGRSDLLQAVFAFGKELEGRGAAVRVAVIPHGEQKQGIDDYLQAGGTLASLEAIPLSDPRFTSTARWWEGWRTTNGADRQESALTAEPPWPTLAPEALQGLAGEIVRAIDPYTEADPVAVLVQFLAMFGCVIGRALHFLVEWTRHPAKLFIILVGDTSKGRKGTSQSTLRRIFGAVDPAFTAGRASRMKSGLSSGEGLIWHVRDPVYDTKKNREAGEDEEVMTDKGEADKRLLIVEPEFAQALKVMAREGNTLSTVIRQAFDDEPLTPLTKNNRITATGSHIAIIGHVTKAELLRYLSETEMANGFCNRFIFMIVRRSKCLPNPKGLSVEQIDLLARRLRDRIEQAHKTADAGPLQRDDKAERLWAEIYPSLSDGKPGLTGAILGRGEVHVMRLALAYALLDGASCIQTPHLLAALALWEWAEASARFIFGEATGDTVADRILEALKNHGPMTETEISDLFQRNAKAGRIHRALGTLQRSRLIEGVIEETGGRKKTVWRATKKTK